MPHRRRSLPTDCWSASSPEPLRQGKLRPIHHAGRHLDHMNADAFSNNWVPMLAPGENILSTIPNDVCVFFSDILGFPFNPATDACLDWNSGTSAASPHVAGAAGLLWSHLFAGQLDQPLESCSDLNGTPCNAVIRSRLQSGADTTGALGQNFLAWAQHGRLNLAGALANTSPPVLPPDPPSGVTATDNANGTVTVSWSDNSNNETGFGLERQKLRKMVHGR